MLVSHTTTGSHQMIQEHPAPNAQRSVRSVERTLDLLMMLEQAGQPVRLTDLARATGIHKATAQRLLQMLERRGLVEKERSHYRVGLATVPLAHAFFLENDLTKAALPVLQELAQATEETASLFVRLGFHRVVVQRIEGLRPLRYEVPIGQRLPLHLGIGKVLAAAMPPEDLNRYLDQVGEMRLASGQVRSRAELLAELEQIRAQGYGIARSERTVGVVSVAAPIVGPDGATLAAIAVIGTTDRITDGRVEQFSIEVRRAAQAVAARCRHG